jgi:hypothetical protein
LIELDCSNNNLNKISYLPNSLIKLDISTNNLFNGTELNLPEQLEILNYDKDKLTDVIYPNFLKKVNNVYV